MSPGVPVQGIHGPGIWVPGPCVKSTGAVGIGLHRLGFGDGRDVVSTTALEAINQAAQLVLTLAEAVIAAAVGVAVVPAGGLGRERKKASKEKAAE